MKNTNHLRQRNRRGIATIEFVMSLPVLIFLIAMLFTLYFATMKKSQLTMEVRHNAWMKRSALDPSKAAPWNAFTAHESGTERDELTRRVTSYTNLYPNVPRRIKWGNVVLTGAWDDHQVEYGGGAPHLNLLVDMALAPGGVKTNPSQVKALKGLLSFPGL